MSSHITRIVIFITPLFITSECTSAPTSKPNSRISPTQLDGVTHVVGDILTYQCLDGYSPATGSDNGEVTCQSDGSWSDSSIVCVVGKYILWHSGFALI